MALPSTGQAQWPQFRYESTVRRPTPRSIHTLRRCPASTCPGLSGARSERYYSGSQSLLFSCCNRIYLNRFRLSTLRARQRASQNGGELSYTSASNGSAPNPRSTLSQRERQFSLFAPLPSLLAFLGGRAQTPSLVRGLRPRNAPSPTTRLVDLVSISVTGLQSKEFPQTTSRLSHQLSVGAGLVPDLAPPPIGGPHDKARPGTCPASLQQPVNNFNHRCHGFPARLFPPQIWDVPARHVLYNVREEGLAIPVLHFK